MRVKMVTGLITKPRPPSTNYKYLFLFSTIFGGSFLLFFINNASDVLFISNDLLASEFWETPRYTIAHNDYAFSIKTPGCSIPALDPYDASVRKYIYYPQHVQNCTQNDTPPLLEANSTHIWVKRELLSRYNVSEDSEFFCCYKAFYRPNFVMDINSLNIDKRVKYEPCVNFQDSAEISHEFVYISCVDGSIKVYEDYFATPVIKDFAQDSTESTAVENATGFNVIVLGIDAVSRMNFYRTMPKTAAFLKNIKAVELVGYNKVGDNTFPNLVPVLMGIPEQDLKKTCHPKKGSTFDNCPFIWDWFKEQGYVTGFGEDSAAIGTFNYFQTGFGSSPTDYYLYTFIHESEVTIGHNKDINSYLCMGGKYFYQFLLDYVFNLVNALKSLKLFGFFWETTMSHDYLNYPMLMDDSYETFLNNMNALGHLDKTVLILMSDHGIRWGDIRQTKQGRIEERLPFVYMLMPKQFRDKYSIAYQNLQINSRRLTTPFDLHETLMDLKDLSEIQNDNIANRMKNSYASSRGISLFLPVPGNRTCEMAHIDDHWCTCHKIRKVDKKEELVLQGVNYLVGWLNELIREYRQCATLALHEVLEASEVDMSDSALQDVTHGWRDYTLSVRVTPSDAVFEATVRRGPTGNWSLAGSVSRLNLYGKQSYCVHDYNLKLYCYCR